MSIDIHALSGAYAVDALDEAERTEFERHIAECDSCKNEVEGLLETAAAMSSVVGQAPPTRLRTSVLHAITGVRPLPPMVRAHLVGRPRRWWAVSASLVLAAALASAVVISRPAASTQSTPTAATQVMTAPDVRVVRTSVARGGSLTWYRSESVGRAVVTSNGLRTLPAAEVYELWLETPDHHMAPAGYLSGGAATVVLGGQAAYARGAGVTVEPSGGSQKPTTVPIAWVGFAAP